MINDQLLYSTYASARETDLPLLKEEFEILKTCRVRAASGRFHFVFETKTKLYYFLRYSNHYELCFSPKIDIFKNLYYLSKISDDFEMYSNPTKELLLDLFIANDEKRLQRTSLARFKIFSKEKLKLVHDALSTNAEQYLQNEYCGTPSSVSRYGDPTYYSGIYYDVEKFISSLK